ncbi:hypothetical protein [Lacisediminihabitans profunda]|uniref:Uncharacterized protein n=1 Tax=Lacisediminihabitans profunda TaxID=2594790 RepID=A0A5C8USZ1_9MICO|nr:hypothetical protein [Lacisediminihabitans profunda]TXN31402.1 hypothetical protein FVP33_07585 [Lacisediminihabitans profunda]
MTTRWARFARGWLAALVATFTALCSHAIAGGGMPSAVAIALSLAFSGLVCVALAGKTLSRVRLTAAVAVSQFAFHGAFSLLGEATLPPGVGSAGMQHSAAQMAAQIADLPAGQAVVGPDATMWLGHAIAAVLTIVAIRRGERAFWGLFDLARLCVSAVWSLVARPVAVRSPDPLASTVATERAIVPRPVDLVFSSLSHRGPPALAAI